VKYLFLYIPFPPACDFINELLPDLHVIILASSQTPHNCTEAPVTIGIGVEDSFYRVPNNLGEGREIAGILLWLVLVNFFGREVCSFDSLDLLLWNWDIDLER
jgi:hypothetical protein